MLCSLPAVFFAWEKFFKWFWKKPRWRSHDFFKKNVQRDNHVGVEAEAKTTVAEVFRANDSGSTHTIQPNSENLINGCRPMLTNMTPVTRSEQGNNRSRVSESLNPCFSRGGEKTRVEFPMPTKNRV